MKNRFSPAKAETGRVSWLAAHRQYSAARRAARDSAKVHQLLGQGEVNAARRLERQAQSRENERRKATPPSAPTPETPPPPPNPGLD